MYFPPNCSQWIQPLDNLLFAILQLTIRKLCQERFDDITFWENGTVQLRELILDATMESIESTFTPHIICKSFDNVGLFPFSPEKIATLAQRNVGTPHHVGRSKCHVARESPPDMVRMCRNAFVKLAKGHETRNKGPKTRTRRVMITRDYAKKGTDGISILEAVDAAELEKKKKQEAKEAKEEKKRTQEKKKRVSEEKKRKISAVTSKIDGCKRVWKDKTSNDDAWWWCGHCEAYGVYWKCWGIRSAKRSLSSHEHVCKKKK